MLWDGVKLLLFLSLCQANALPLASQLSEEDEKVTKCIMEILADTLSKPSPVPVTSDCMKILREDERVLAMLHHQHLLTELEDLAHQENAKHRLGHEDGRDPWEGEGEEREEVKKREERPGKQREAAASEKTQEQDGMWKEEGQGLKEYQKTEKIEEKVKEVSHGEDNREALEEEAAKEEMEDKGEEDESRKKKKRASSETWSSQEYFGHMKNRGSGGPKIREVMLRGSQDDVKRSSSDKRPFELEEEEEEDDHSEEKPRSHHHGGHHHEDWEEEEEEGEKRRRRRADLSKRVAEKASDEETAQFEEKGVKISNSKGHLHGGWKPWPEEEEEEEGETRYGHHHRPASMDLKRHHQEDYPKGRHHSHEEDEGGREAGQNEEQELEKLEEIEHDLQKAAEKLRELKRSSPLPSRHGQV
uniref:coiled-coil domain-containing glutamate-rich protein 2 n=1 Tax=Euleptes europaea TaxID=460621 RepID=UPI00253FE40C|nr:coiled-coil domain-containing glutamate-rich protein 2 [Euleptes europaea]